MGGLRSSESWRIICCSLLAPAPELLVGFARTLNGGTSLLSLVARFTIMSNSPTVGISQSSRYSYDTSMLYSATCSLLSHSNSTRSDLCMKFPSYIPLRDDPPRSRRGPSMHVAAEIRRAGRMSTARENSVPPPCLPLWSGVFSPRFIADARPASETLSS